MNVKKLGVPVYKTEGYPEHVLRSDLKLALDSDVFKKLMDKWDNVYVLRMESKDKIPVSWLSNQY